MLMIAALFDDWPEAREAPAVRLLGARPLAALMATARVELGRERILLCRRRPELGLACGSAPRARERS